MKLLAIIIWYLIIPKKGLSINFMLSNNFVKCSGNINSSNMLSCNLPPTNVVIVSSKIKCASYCASVGSGQESNNSTLDGKINACMGFNYQLSNGTCQLFDQPCSTSNLIEITNEQMGICYQAVKQPVSACHNKDCGENLVCEDAPGTDPQNSSVKYYADCNEVPGNGSQDSGVYCMKVENRTFPVYCQISENGTKYTVIQRRMDGSVDFYRNWTEYENGFGNVKGEYWLGDSLSYHDGMMFSTNDVDNDETSGNCAVIMKGGWWFKDCFNSNLNGKYYHGRVSPAEDGIAWLTFTPSKSLEVSKMLITRK